MSLLPSRMQFADVGDFKPLGSPLRHREERHQKLAVVVVKFASFSTFEEHDHGAPDSGCAQEQLPNLLGNGVAVRAAYAEFFGAACQKAVDAMFQPYAEPEPDTKAQLEALVALRSSTPVCNRDVLPGFWEFPKPEPSLMPFTQEEARSYLKGLSLGLWSAAKIEESEVRLKAYRRTKERAATHI